MLHCSVVTPYGVLRVCKPLMTKKLSVLFFLFQLFSMQGGQ